MDAENLPQEMYARIAARSKRQAMDWSLVLASQEIHPIISPPNENTGWALLVEPSQYETALKAIQQYRAENRGWGWKQELPGSNLEIHSAAFLWCVFLGFWHWMATFIWPGITAAGKMDSVLVSKGEWWRLLTPIILHADLAHLMANVTFGLVIMGLGMARYGPGITLLVTYFSGAAGNLMGLQFYSRPYTGVGASGMMMGALGLLCAHSVGLWPNSPKAGRYILSGVFAGFLLFILFGVDPSSDILAHLGGFAAGILFGIGLSLMPEAVLQKTRWNFLSFLLVSSMLVITWGLALSNK